MFSRRHLRSFLWIKGQYFAQFSTNNPLIYKEEILTIDKDIVWLIKKDDLLNGLSDTQLNSFVLIHKQNERKHWIEESMSGLVLSNEYDSIGHYQDGICVVWKDNHCGFINKRGDEIVACKYDDFGMTQNGLSTVKLNNKWGATNNKGEFIIPVQYDFCKPRKDGYWDVSRDGNWEPDFYMGGMMYGSGKWGICDNKGREIVPCIFRSSLSRLGDFFIGYGSIFSSGVIVYKPNGESLFSNINFEEMRLIKGETSLFWMKTDAKWGIVGLNGFFVCPNEYDDVKDFEGNTCPVKRNGKWGIINKKGDVLLNCSYDSIERDKNTGKYKVSINNHYGLVDESARVIADCRYDCINIRSYYSEVKVNGRWGVIDWRGIVVVPIQYDSVSIDRRQEAFIFKSGGKYGVLNKQGLQSIPCIYDSLCPSEDGVIIAKINERVGLLSITGRNITGMVYDNIKYVSGLGYCAQLNGMWGILNELGYNILPFKYYFIGGGNDSMYPVNVGGGEEKLSAGPYGGVCGERYPECVLGGQWGFVNYNLKEVVPCQFEACTPFKMGFSVVKKNDKMGVIDRQGNIIVPLKYSYCSILSETSFLIAVNTWVSVGESEYDALDDKYPILRGMYGMPYKAQRWRGEFDFFIKGGKYGVYSIGKEIIPPIYDKIIPNKDRTLYIVLKNKKYGLIDNSGRILINVEYDLLSIA